MVRPVHFTLSSLDKGGDSSFSSSLTLKDRLGIFGVLLSKNPLTSRVLIGILAVSQCFTCLFFSSFFKICLAQLSDPAPSLRGYCVKNKDQTQTMSSTVDIASTTTANWWVYFYFCSILHMAMCLRLSTTTKLTKLFFSTDLFTALSDVLCI